MRRDFLYRLIENYFESIFIAKAFLGKYNEKWKLEINQQLSFKYLLNLGLILIFFFKGILGPYDTSLSRVTPGMNE